MKIQEQVKELEDSKAKKIENPKSGSKKSKKQKSDKEFFLYNFYSKRKLN